MWGYIDGHRSENESGTYNIDIWNFQEISMSAGDMQHHNHNEATKHYRWIYNDMSPTGMAMAMANKKFDTLKKMRKRCTSRVIIIAAQDAGETHIVVNCDTKGLQGLHRRGIGIMEGVQGGLQQRDQHSGRRHDRRDVGRRARRAGLHALKEMMATMDIEQHLDIAPVKKAWTWPGGGGKDQKRYYDYLFCNKQFSFEGAPTRILKRGDHGAVAMNIEGSMRYKLTADAEGREAPNPPMGRMPPHQYERGAAPLGDRRGEGDARNGEHAARPRRRGEEPRATAHLHSSAPHAGKSGRDWGWHR